MDINPYQSPEQPSQSRTSQSPQWKVFGKREPRRVMRLDRPTGVTLLCLAQVTIIAFQFVFYFGMQLPFVIAGLQAMSIPAGPYLTMILIAWVFGLVAAAGIWSGARWGWWCGAYFCAYSIWHSLFGIAEVALLMRSNAFAGRPESTGYVLLFVGRIPVLLLIFVYFFSFDFLAYVGRTTARRGLTAALILALAAGQELLQIGLLYLLH